MLAPLRCSFRFKATALSYMAWWILLAGCTTPLPHNTVEPMVPFRSDGCSVAPDLNVRTCCDEHDKAYWAGGSCEARRTADRQLRECIRALDRPRLASLYYAGVRIGGSPWWPFPWRWGFGWPYGMGYSERCDERTSDQSSHDVAACSARRLLIEKVTPAPKTSSRSAKPCSSTGSRPNDR